MRRILSRLLVCSAFISPSLALAASSLAQGESGGIAVGDKGMVVSTQSYATEAGAKILREGGNAVDAAVAVGYALAVVHPAAGNIGGGGFMLIRFKDGATRFLDFRERAPGKATETLFQDKDGNVVPEMSQAGYMAAGIPGTVLGLETAREKYGTMRRDKLLEPAIKLATDGFKLRGGDVDQIAYASKNLARDAEAARIFLTADLNVPRIGTNLRQPDLAKSLKLIAKDGPDAFYKGPIADLIAKANAKHGGIMQKEDFANYRIHEHEPVRCDYRGYQVITAAPPSSGGVAICETLNILEGFDLAGMGFHSAQAVHTLAESMRRAFFDRNSSMGDPDFVTNPVEHFIDKDYAAKLRAGISPDKATPSLSLGTVEAAPREGKHTTDYMVMDNEGNAVSVVYTLNDWFGAKIVPEGTGIVLNNEMDDFSAKPGAPNEDGLVTGVNNAIKPGKAPMSSMSPTILTKDGKTLLAVGSFGSGTIATSVIQAIVNLVNYKMTVAEAVDAPRVHQQWLPDRVDYDKGAFDDATAAKLRAMGYELHEGTEAGASEAILVGGPRLGENDGKRFHGANDRRAPVGSAVGW